MDREIEEQTFYGPFEACAKKTPKFHHGSFYELHLEFAEKISAVLNFFYLTSVAL